MAGPLLPLTKRQISSMNAIEALGILQDRPDEGDSEKRVQEQKAARTRLKQLEKTEAGRAAIKKARKDLELDVKANMKDGGKVLPKEFLGRAEAMSYEEMQRQNKLIFERNSEKEAVEKLIDAGFTRQGAKDHIKKLKKTYAPKKKAQKKMGGGKVYSRGSRKASYNG
jgi:hypothetical protein